MKRYVKQPVTFRELPILSLFVLKSTYSKGIYLKVDDQETVSLVTHNNDFPHEDELVLCHNIPTTGNGFLMVLGERYLWPSYANRELFTGVLNGFKFKYKAIKDMPKTMLGNIRYKNANGQVDWRKGEVIATYQNEDDAIQLSQTLFWSFRPTVQMLIDPDSPADNPRKQSYDQTHHFYKGVIY